MLKNKITYVALSVMLFFVQSTLAARGQLSGTISNKETGQPIPDANIVVLDTGMGTVSRDGGFYFLSNLPDGKQQIQVSVIGYETVIGNVFIPEDKVLHFELEPKVIEFDPVVVTATLSEHRRSNVTITADVLTETRMQELNGNMTGEIVESVSGVYSKSYDGFAGLNTPSIRGSEASQVLVLMDGVRLNTAQGGGVDLNTIPLAAIERIEIIKGGHSALLGSDAVGGVIHLISNDAVSLKGFNYGMNTTLGSFGTRIYTVNGSHRLGPIALFASYDRTQSEGNFKYKDPQSGNMGKRINNDSKTENLFLKSRTKFNTLNTLQVIYRYYHTQNGIAGSIYFPSPKTRSDVRRNTLTVESSTQLSNRLLFKEQIGYHTYNYHYTDLEWMVNDLHKNTSVSALIQGLYSVNDHIGINIGLNYQKDKLISSKYTNVDSRIMTSLFGQIELKHSLAMTQWVWIPAVRWDDYNDIGSSISPKLGVMVTRGKNANYALKSNIGKSYRVPSLNDLYWPTEDYGIWGGVEGNPDLKPEYGINFDIGFSYSLFQNAFVQFDATYFYNNIKDLIIWTMDTEMWSRPSNVISAKIRGIESGLRFRLPSEVAHIHINYTRMKATDETEGSGYNGKRLKYRPDNKWDILVGTKLGPVYGNLNYRIVSKSFITDDNSASLDSYQILDGNIGTSIKVSGLNVNMKLQGLNLMNKHLFIADGYPLPGREFRFTVGIEY